MGAIYFVGAGPLGLPALRAARECGLAVVATDRNPDAPGFALADRGCVLDGTDVEGHLAFARTVREPIAGVVCGAEFGARTVQRLQAAFGLETNDAAAIERVLDKRAMKRAFLAASVPTPPAHAVRDAGELALLLAREGGDWVLKPAGGSGSRGVRLVGEGDDLAAAVAASRTAVGGALALVAEPYLAGRSIDANGLFLGGAFHPAGVLEKVAGPAPDFLPVGGWDPPDLPPAERETVYALLERACRAVGIAAGPVKGDFLRTDEGYVALEVAPRFHGDVTTCHTLPYGSRIDPLRFWFRFLATGEADPSLLAPREVAFATWRVLGLPPGRIESLADPRRAALFPRLTLLWHNPRLAGCVPRYADTTQIPGYVAAWGEDRAAAEETIAAWFASAGYRVTPDPVHAEWFARLREHLAAHGLASACAPAAGKAA
ncbi:MAG: ATP-grasp domain-containing protein [Planctomycetota bacterium]